MPYCVTHGSHSRGSRPCAIKPPVRMRLLTKSIIVPDSPHTSPRGIQNNPGSIAWSALINLLPSHSLRSLENSASLPRHSGTAWRRRPSGRFCGNPLIVLFPICHLGCSYRTGEVLPTPLCSRGSGNLNSGPGGLCTPPRLRRARPFRLASATGLSEGARRLQG